MDKKRIFSNTLWLMSEKLISVFGLIFVTSYVAKYIGPDNFGKLNLAIYIYSVIQTIAVWGSDTIATKKISKNRVSGKRLLFSLVKLRVAILVVTSIPIISYMYFEGSYLLFVYTLAVFVSTSITVMDVYIIYNDVSLNSKYNVLCNVIGVICSLAIRACVVYLKLPAEYISFSIIALAIIPFLIRRYIFTLTDKQKPEIKSIDARRYLKYVFLAGIPLVISNISVSIYFYSSRLMLGALSSASDVGIFSVAVTLGTAWNFVTNAVLTSMSPKLFSSKSNKDAEDIFSCMNIIVLLMGGLYYLFFIVVGEKLIVYLYGNQYLTSFNATLPLILATTVSALGVSATRFIVHHGGYSFLGKKTAIVCMIGVGSSYIFIKLLGMQGAAYSTLFVEVISLTVMNYFFKGKLVLKSHAKIFNIKNVISTLRRI